MSLRIHAATSTQIDKNHRKIRAWKSNCITRIIMDVINNPCPNVSQIRHNKALWCSCDITTEYNARKPHITCDFIKWKHFPGYWPFVWGIHRSPVNSTQKGQWRGALMFSLIYARINGWVNIGEADDLRRHHPHNDVIVMDMFNSV